MFKLSFLLRSIICRKPDGTRKFSTFFVDKYLFLFYNSYARLLVKQGGIFMLETQPQFEIWQEVKGQLEMQLERNTFSEIFDSVDSVFKVRNNYIYLIVENEFIKKRIEMLYLKRMNRILENYVDDKHEYKLITKNQAEEEMAKEETHTSNQKILDEDFKHTYLNTNLNPSYTFRNFVVGNSNRLAYTSAIKVADQPGIVANPLYIFGDVGLGKTHLMHCVGNYILEGDINTKVLYVKADQFVEDYVRYASKKRFNEFNKIYRNVDVLLVDDIQFLAKKDKSQEEFFKLFEQLHNQRKQIVITSDRKASDLKDVMARLTSRFSWGVTVDINRPDLDHRIQILEKKLMAETSETNLMPQKVIEYIASVFDNNVRELEGALKRVLFYCTAFDFEFSIKNAETALENLVRPKEKHKDFVRDKVQNVLSVVSDYYNISTSDLISKKRKRIYLYPRQVAMFLIKDLYELPYKRIGAYFSNRDHSTVMHSIEKINNEMQMDVNVKTDVEKLKHKCGDF